MKIKICVLILFCSVLTGCSNKSKTVSKVYAPDEISAIRIDNTSYELLVRQSTDQSIHLKYSSNGNSGDPKIHVQDKTLQVSQKNSSKQFIDSFSFGQKKEILLYLPSEYHSSLSINNNSGNVKMDSLSLRTLSISNQSGDQKLDNVSVGNAEFSSKDGDISLKDCPMTHLSIDTSSGYVVLDNSVVSDLKTNSKSGEVNIKNLNKSKETVIHTTSGDIAVSYKKPPSDLAFNIASNSDDITLRLPDMSFQTETSSCKKGSTGQGKNVLEISSDSGTIEVH